MASASSSALRCGPHGAEDQGHGPRLPRLGCRGGGEASPRGPLAQPRGVSARSRSARAGARPKPGYPQELPHSPLEPFLCTPQKPRPRRTGKPHRPGELAAYIRLRNTACGARASACCQPSPDFGQESVSRLGSAVVWSKFNLFHTRGHGSGRLCRTESSRGPLTRVT